MGVKPRLDFGDDSPENSLQHDGTAVADRKVELPTDRKPDFTGWATKYNLECSDGRTILPDAFEHQDMTKVPLVWAHGHDDSDNVLGHAFLQHRKGEGVYAFGFFNENEKSQNAKELVVHDDINQLSIYANKLKEVAGRVKHGMIRELSMVMAGANPGALIDNLELTHSDGEKVIIDDEAIIFTGETLKHGDEVDEELEQKKEEESDEDEDGPTVQDVYDGFTDDQKHVVHHMIGEAYHAAKTLVDDKDDKTAVAHSATSDDDKELQHMGRNAFEEAEKKKGGSGSEHTLSHSDLQGIAQDAVRMGSLKAAVNSYAIAHGIDNIDTLFPDAKTLQDTPDFDKRRTEWVRSVMNGTRHTPFSRIKTITADLTQEAARAKGYIKGHFKKEEWFGLIKRVTTPTTVYKKQELDRDDVIDVTDFDLVAWLKGEMRLMLEEELARGILIGDGRDLDDEDHIRDPAGPADGAGIRSILNDHDLYVAKLTIPYDDAVTSPQDIVDFILLHMSEYKGSGSPTFYTTLPFLNRLLLARDGMGRRLWKTASDLAAEIGVSSIVTVEVMEEETEIFGIIVNLQDYNIGTDRGGDISMFDDFDIDFNKYKYLIETRLSGALTKIRSALVLRKGDPTDTARTPVAPTFDQDTGDIVVPTTTGVSYRRRDTDAAVSGSTITLDPGESLTIYAVPTATNYFETTARTEWKFDRHPAVA